MEQTPEAIRDNHYENLNAYRDLPGYADRHRSNETAAAFFASLTGRRWEIDAAIYDEFLNMLPPLHWRNGSFYMIEPLFDGIAAKFTHEGGRYYCEYAFYPSRQAA